jgi:pyruvate dehydrogenase E2 component (dihydrolipoamide acetyltransferase)/2-oxoglutarate dehydrogenase E2 component (dihydrolipoamide succinyltransferase)
MADVTAHRITARCSSTGVAEFIAKMHSLGGMDLSANMIWASFAVGAWRSAESTEGTLIIELTELTQSLGRFENLDRQRLSQPSQYDGQQGTDLILQDLSKTAITSVSFGANLPTLTIGNETSQYFITFEYGAEQISNAAALTFVSDFAARLEDPLRHLL